VRRAWSLAAIGVTAVLAVTGCDRGGSGGGAAASPGLSQPSASGSASSAPETAVSFTPASGAVDVRPGQEIVVNAQGGVLTTVQVRSSKGATLDGELAADGSSWRSTGRLATASTYTVSARTRSSEGTEGTATSTFTTVKPSALANVRLNVGDGRTYGVGMPIIVTFDRAVKNRDAAEKAMTVTTTPEVEGDWNWLRGGTEAWWRPKEFWPKGTKVDLKAALGDVELSPGLWGRRTYTAGFSIGSSVISTVDVQKHTLTVTKDGAPVRTIKVTTGMEKDPRFRTRGGTKVIIEKFESIRMDAATTGTDPKDPEFYNTVEHWALRLTWSGEFLHFRPGSDRYFGRVNVSHGCTGMSEADAKWMFGFSQVGDVVKYVGSQRPLEVANGYTVWDVPWSQWTA